MSVLTVNDLVVTATSTGRRIVDGLSFDVEPGTIVAIVGESGSGKSTVCLAVIGLLSEGLEIEQGSITLADTDVAHARESTWRSLRGDAIGMIFQDSLAALNPVRTIGFQLREARLLHHGRDRAAARQWSVERLASLGFTDPETILASYPHELSGGMRQRVCAAIAFAGAPDVVLADEPTTALDVSLQGRMLKLLIDETRATGSGLVLVSHDMAVVEAVADHIVVMYGGRALERGPASTVLASPASPYTRALLESVPSLDPATRGRDLPTIPGEFVPHARGCPFRDRCKNAIDACGEAFPEPTHDESGRTFWCWNP